MSFKLEAIKALVPDANFTMINDSEILDWDSEKEIPSDEAIQAKQTELQADYDSKQYQRDRAVAYPSIQDQLDMLYHQGIDGWKEEIKKVKDAHPKPEST